MDKNNYSFTSYHIGENGDISYKTILLDEDRRDRRMTIEELLEEIKQQVGTLLEELKKQVEALSDDEKKIRTLPIEDGKYFYIGTGKLSAYESYYPDWFDNFQTKENSSIGNYFKSKEDAEMVIRAMQIEQSIRIRRIELNDGWEPDWGDVNEVKYFIFYGNNKYIKNDILPEYTYGFNDLPIFGYYKSIKIAQQIIDEFEDDLHWYFTEYYPNKDKMYVWGD